MIVKSNGYLEEYYEKSKSGEIVIGQELKIELENLMDDMQSDRYRYDTTDADERIDFIENCVRLTKSPFYGKPMILMLFQKAYISALYGFKMLDGTDRFKKSILLEARKNGKTELCGGIGLAEFFMGKEGADIVCSSNDDIQASILYDSIDLMRQMIDPRDLDSKRNQRFILNKITNTKIFKMSERTRNKEGRNIDIAFQDETHELKENTIPKSIEQSQSLKENPKFINITTEGFVNDGYLDKELKRARAIIMGEATDIASERFLPWLYTQDSEREIWDGNRENRLWMKSNPTLGEIKKWEYLEEQVSLAKESKADRIFVLSKDFNIKTNSAEAWLNLEDYSYNSEFDIEDLRGGYCLGAVDLSETTDLTCAKALILRDNKKHVLTQYFIPESKLEDSDDIQAGAKYKEWAEKGYLTITEGNDIDLAQVADWFYSLIEEYDITLYKCGYDQRFAKDWLNRMSYYSWERTGDDPDLIMVLQNAQTLSNAIKLCEADFKHQLIYYNNNEMDRWCLGNAGIQVDNRGQALIVKMEQNKRIDGAVCLAILYEIYRRYRTDFQEMSER